MFQGSFLYCGLNSANSLVIKDLLIILCIQNVADQCVLIRLILDLCTQMVSRPCKLCLLLVEVWLHERHPDHVLTESSMQKSDPMKATIILIGLRNVCMHNCKANSSCFKRYWNAMVSWKAWYKTDEWDSHSRWGMNETTESSSSRAFAKSYGSTF